MSDVERLQEVLANGETSIKIAAVCIGRSTWQTYLAAKSRPDLFSIVGLQGPVGSYCVGLAGDRSIQLIFDAQSEETR